MSFPIATLRKISAHLRLLRDDPEKFAANFLQFTNRKRFLARLLDVQAAAPMHLRIARDAAEPPAVNVLQPILSPVSMTGGPNTIINVAFQLAREGVPVRIVTTRSDGQTDYNWFRQHVLTLTGAAVYPDLLQVAFAGDAGAPLRIGARDMFLATHWTTAQQLKAVLPDMEVRRFFYLIQDFEPGFHAWSSNYALALETYELDFIPVINERLLHDYFMSHAVGRFAEADFAAESLPFEPAIDTRLFHPAAARTAGQPRRLLFYARPTNARNLLGIGLQALRNAVANGVFADAAWEFQAIGGRGSLPELDLGGGKTLRPSPWADYASYARQLREADILLCPMLSPHTSYPVLEMAASGGIAVTNSFATKTVERLAAISPNIVASRPTVEGFTVALAEAVARIARGDRATTPPNLPTDWDAALASVTPEMARRFHALVRDPAGG